MGGSEHLLVTLLNKAALSMLTISADTAIVLGDFRNRHPECHSTFLRG